MLGNNIKKFRKAAGMSQEELATKLFVVRQTVSKWEPVVILFITCALTIKNFEAVVMVTMAAWIGIPGVISYIFYWKKMYGKF